MNMHMKKKPDFDSREAPKAIAQTVNHASEKAQITKWHQTTGALIVDTLSCLAQGITGIAASDRKELVFSVSHILQSLRKGHFLSRLLQEWHDYRKKGKIPEDYHTTEQHQVCLQELLDFLDKDLPDDIRFQTLKKIFVTAATEGVCDRNSLLPCEYMRLCRRMSSGEILVLNAAYQVAEEGFPPNLRGAHEWLKIVADKSSLIHPSLVEIHEEQLMIKCLLTG